MRTVRAATERAAQVDTRRIAIAIAAFLTAGLLLFPSAGWDDAYITYWLAHALSTLGQMVNVNGDAVEQSSSLGFVISLALLNKLTGIDVSILGRLASIGFGTAAVVMTAQLGRRVHAAAVDYAPIVVATSCYFVYWSFGGMEASLAALSGLLLLIAANGILEHGATARRVIVVALACSLFASSRPENLLIVVTTLAGLGAVQLLRRRWQMPAERWEERATHTLVAIASSCAIGGGAVVLFRLWYFGRSFPQPVYVKAHALSKQKVIDGLSYVITSLASEFVIMAVLGGLAAALVLVLARPFVRGATVTVTAAFLVANFIFIVMSGGDGMHGGRFFVPAIPMAAVLGVALLASRLSAGTLRIAVAAWVAGQIGGTLVFARYQSHSDPSWAVASAEDLGAPGRFHWFERANHDHRRYVPVILELERQIAQARLVQQPVTVLSGQSGFVLYHLAKTRFGAIRYFDRFGLVTRDFADCSISAGLPHTEWGLLLTIDDYARRADRFQQACGIPPPQIIFELISREVPPGLDRALSRAGYALTYVQKGDTPGRSTVFPGQAAEGVYIAVRRSRPGQSSD